MGRTARAAVFLDRDGTIIEDRNYLSDPVDVRLLPGAASAVRRLNDVGFPVIVVTNQSGIGRGYFDEARYHAVAARLDRLLALEGARIDATYYCPHAPDDPSCSCRKPGTALFLQAAREHGLDLSTSYYVGDRIRDVAPGLGFGGTGYLIEPGDVPEDQELPRRCRRVESLRDAVDHVLHALRFD